MNHCFNFNDSSLTDFLVRDGACGCNCCKCIFLSKFVNINRRVSQIVFILSERINKIKLNYWKGALITFNEGLINLKINDYIFKYRKISNPILIKEIK